MLPKNSPCLLQLLLTLVLALPAILDAGEIVYVDDDAPASGDGLSWETAFTYLQDGLAYAQANDVATIRVGEGVYVPDRDEDHTDGDGDREATFQLMSVLVIEGGYAGHGTDDPDERDIDLYESILSGDLDDDDDGDPESMSDNSLHVVTGSGVNSSATLDGFTITAGFAIDDREKDDIIGGGIFMDDGSPTISNCRLIGNHADAGGGMAMREESKPDVLDCTFEDNVGTSGGGLYCAGGNRPIFERCDFVSNVANIGPAMHCADESDPEFTDCTISFHESGENWDSAAVHLDGDCNVKFDTCTFEGNCGDEGGAIKVDFGNLRTFDCVYSDNFATGNGGAINFDDEDSKLTLRGCDFENNTSRLGVGGAVFMRSKDFLIEDCTFTDNEAEEGGGGAWLFADRGTLCYTSFVGNLSSDGIGGGLALDKAEAYCFDCDFEDNRTDDGGGLGLDASLSGYQWAPVFAACRFIDNSTRVGHGGGAFVRDDATRPIFLNCLFLHNSALGDGGAVYNDRGGTTMVNCTVVGNDADVAGGFYNAASIFAPSDIKNCVFWNNEDDGGTDEEAQIFYGLVEDVFTLDHSCVEGLTGDLGGTGNIGDDPEFVDPDNDDYRLQPHSPCIDAGREDYVPDDGKDVDDDFDTAETYPFDLLGEDRVLLREVDIGAYEATEATDGVVYVRGDCNDDGLVGLADGILILFQIYQDTPSGDCLSACNIDDNTIEKDSVEVPLIDMCDAIHVFNWQFLDGPPPASPFPDCGWALTDYESCTSQVSCEPVEER